MTRNNIQDIINKKGKEKITCLTSYTAPIAKIVDQYADMILVGDTLGMVVYGMENTCNVTMRMMIDHGKAVVNATQKAFIVVDMPFGSYEDIPSQALENARKIIKETGCDAVKLECNADTIKIVDFLVKNGVAVVGHVGLLPQHFKDSKDYKYQGKEIAKAQEIMLTSLALQEAGACALVIECIPEQLAAEISKKLKIPTIGIGASKDCDGQVLVIDDLVGMEQKLKPKFVKQYTNLTSQIDQAVQLYCQEVKSGAFPTEKNVFKIKD